MTRREATPFEKAERLRRRIMHWIPDLRPLR